MSEKSCFNCYYKNESENEFCQECGSPLDLSDYINSKKVDKSILDKIRSLFGKKTININDINRDIENFIRTSIIIEEYNEDLKNLKSSKLDKSEFKNKYSELFKLYELEYLEYVLKDDDLNQKFSRIKSIESGIENYDEIEQFHNDFNELLDSNFYVTFKQKDDLLKDYKKLYSLIKEDNYLKIDFEDFLDVYNNMESLIGARNEKYVQNELIEHKDFLDDIEGKSLDKNQRLAVVRNEHNSQIIAGAGCGKTLTVNAKVRYLIEKKGIAPNEILCLSFSNASVEDLRKNLPEDVEISTFHSLGGSILKANKQPSSVDEYALNNFVKDYIRNNVIDNERLRDDIVNYYSYYFYSPVTEDDATTLGEVYDLEASRDFRTLRQLYGGDNEKRTYGNEVVRSFEELIISNYLFAHQIDYEYEKVFEFDNRYYQSQKEFIFNLIFKDFSEITDYPIVMDDISGNMFELLEIKEHVKLYNYTPDFYIKDNDLYLEHFGVNRDCNALWRDEEGQKEYRDGIYWKRATHKGYGSNLLETYSYYMSEGRLLIKLEEILKESGVEIKEINYEWLFSKITERNDVNKFNKFIDLITEFISLFKGNDYAADKFSEFKKENESNEDEFDKKRTSLFLDIVEEIYLQYESYLNEISKIDFNDMINNATREVEKGNLHQHYRYILVDEYQDTSYTRYNLVKAIQDKTDAKVCVVGDDWQSIYRFAGCDVSLFSNFENYFENPDKLTIQTTYRNSQELIDISGRFIKKNPNQIDKSLNSKKDSTNKPVKLVYYNNASKESKIKAMEFMINKISKDSSDIMILGRNNFDINDFIEGGLFERKNKDDYELIYKKNKKLNIDFISVHKSKGLEKDNVILINLENNVVGFPNQMVEDKLLNFVINDSDQYPNGEERRLFYVALTRTKNNVYLLVPETDKSEFVIELEENIDDLEIISHDENKEEIIDDIDEFMKNKKVYSIKTHLKCPICKTGDVLLKILKTNDGEDIVRFFDCSHRRCEWRGGSFYSSLELLDEIEICPDCGKVKHIVNGPYGPYIRCSKECKNIKLKGKKLEKANKIFNNENEAIKNDKTKTNAKTKKRAENKKSNNYDEITTKFKC
ncbi:UvrD-helicase domain-containing protein, partial [Methanobrevibacter sp.]|uniref:UvrD-helicase domain-containing protein n=1 Tax=Methanobrevibacter sp. TaxID=66852 RepID=UPI0026DEA2E3